MFFISVYAREDSRKKFLEKLDSLFENLRLDAPNNFCIIVDDLNAQSIA